MKSFLRGVGIQILSMDLFAMPDPHYQDQKLFILFLVDHSIAAHPEAVFVFEFFLEWFDM